MAWFENDPGAVNVRGGILGPMTGSQRAAMLFAGLRDAVGNFSGRPTENLNQLAEQYGQQNYRQQVRQDRLTDKEEARKAEQEKRDWELKNRAPKLETAINPATGKMAQFYLDPVERKPVFVDVALPAEAPKTRTIRMGMQDITQEFNPITGQWSQIAKGAAFKPDAPSKGTDAPSGFRWAADGRSMEPIPGGPSDPRMGAGRKAPTEDQNKNTQLYTRAAKQLPTAEKYFDELAKPRNQIFAGIGEARLPLLGVGVPKGMVTGTEYQQAEGALNDIAASYLYSVSGATATPSEIAGTVERIKPKFGDGDAQVADKKKRMRDMVESIKMRAIPGTSVPQAEGSAPAASGVPATGSVVKGYRFEGGNPADQNNWVKI